MIQITYRLTYRNISWNNFTWSSEPSERYTIACRFFSMGECRVLKASSSCSTTSTNAVSSRLLQFVLQPVPALQYFLLILNTNLRYLIMLYAACLQNCGHKVYAVLVISCTPPSCTQTKATVSFCWFPVNVVLHSSGWWTSNFFLQKANLRFLVIVPVWADQYSLVLVLHSCCILQSTPQAE